MMSHLSVFWPYVACEYAVTSKIETLTTEEVDRKLFLEDPDLYLDACDLRDLELYLDLIGSLDSCA